MKTHALILLASTLLCTGCASIQLSSKKDDSFSGQIKSVYIQANPGSKYDEDLYAILVTGLKKELKARGIQVKEEFTDLPDSPGMEGAAGDFKADATLILEKNAEEKFKVNTPVVTSFGGLGINISSPTYDRFMIRLTDAHTAKDIWVGMASVRYGERRYAAKKLVNQFEKDGLVSRIKK
ncbi:MAG: hypothetical protein IPJ82_17465 [Lewinellaceae bacterium]|nr:hypothetical protein [Lewinellaceae bacterium]